MIRCTVVFALPDREWEWALDLHEGDTVAAALSRAQQLAESEADAPVIAWATATVGIHGEVRPRATVLVDGDRVEIYRSLQVDPKESRRDRARRLRTRG